MSLEQKLRDNLHSAAQSLVVPESKRPPGISSTSPGRHGFRFALAGAAMVMALAVPALILWTGGPTLEADVSTTPDPVLFGSMAQASTTSTTAAPSTTTVSSLPATTAILAETTAGDYELVLIAERIDVEDPPTATVTLRSVRSGNDEAGGEAAVGGPGVFFWHNLSGPDAVCEFNATPTDAGADVTVQVLVSPSMGCSEPYSFQITSAGVVPTEVSPEDVARLFLSAWQGADEATMSVLADPEAIAQSEGLSPPPDPTFAGCEGAAGSVYCVWEDGDQRLVLRVKTEPPAKVIEVFTEPIE